MAIKFYTLQDKILNMRKNKCRVPLLLKEAIKWEPNLDELIILCSVLGILQKHDLAVKKNEVKKAFLNYYKAEYHGTSQGYLFWIYKEFDVRKQSSFSKGGKTKYPNPQRELEKTYESKGKALQTLQTLRGAVK